MRDSLDDLDLDGGRISEMKSTESSHAASAASASSLPASQLRRAISGKHVCPFCGTQRDSDLGACPNCSLEDSATTRSATRSKLGPWYVLQSRNPSAPGMNFETLMVLVQKGRVTARSIVRGPTTGQFWRHAARVKGVSRQFGLCWSCGGDVAKTARACPACKRLQEPPDDPDVLLEDGVEVSEEEIAEAVWADHGPTPTSEPVRPVSRPTPAPTPVGKRAAPAEPATPVDRLVARGGVRREVPPSAARAASAPGTGRASLSPAATEELPASNLDMAVFHRPRPRDGSGRGVTGKILKGVFVAVLMLCSGVVVMASFDAGMREQLITWGEKSKTWAATALDRLRNAPTRPTPNDRTAPAGGGELARAADPSAGGGDVLVGPPVAAAAQAGSPDQAKLRMWELWRVGVEAERKNDFSAAVKAWEQIKGLKVPADELPLGFDARLATAKKRAR